MMEKVVHFFVDREQTQEKIWDKTALKSVVLNLGVAMLWEGPQMPLPQELLKTIGKHRC